MLYELFFQYYSLMNRTTEEAKNRLQMPRKRSLPDEELLSPKAKVLHDHSYAKRPNIQTPLLQFNEDQEIQKTIKTET